MHLMLELENKKVELDIELRWEEQRFAAEEREKDHEERMIIIKPKWNYARKKLK